MMHRLRIARKRLGIADERIWAAWFKFGESTSSYKRKLQQFRAIERRKERIA